MIMIDIEMPEKCCECPCFHAEYPMHCQLIKQPDKNKRLAAPYGLPRPDWCPLKEYRSKIEPVPSHEDEDGVPHCGSCGWVQSWGCNYCDNCGKPLRWE